MNVEEILTGEELEKLVEALRSVEPSIPPLESIRARERMETIHYHVFAASATKATRERRDRQEYVCFAVPENERGKVFWEAGKPYDSHSMLDALADKLAAYATTLSTEKNKEELDLVMSITLATPYTIGVHVDGTISSRSSKEGPHSYRGRPLEIDGWKIQIIKDISPEYHQYFETRFSDAYERYRSSSGATAQEPDQEHDLTRFDGERGAPGGK